MAACLSQWSKPLFRLPLPGANIILVFSFAILLALLAIGFWGPTDPLRNLLPLSIWILWWVVIVLLHPLLGHFWDRINPLGLFRNLVGQRSFPLNFGFWPAVILFLGFAWFQLIHPRAEDPRTLTLTVLIYGAITIACCAIFGGKMWFERGDPFAIVFRLLGLFAPFNRTENGWVHLSIPGSRLMLPERPPVAAALLVFATLSTISFDAVSASFTWLSLIGVNPLDYPGRTALIWPNTLGLLGFFLLLSGAIVFAVWLGWLAAERPGKYTELLGRFTLSFLPISIAFHFAHYLTALLVNGQYLWISILHPLGGGHAHVTTSFLTTAQGAWTIFSLQAVAIVLGHVVSVLVVHMIVVDSGISGQRALRLELPLAVFMVGFTGFGLWALSTPSIG